MPTEITKLLDSRKPVYRYIGTHKSRGSLHQVVSEDGGDIVTWSIGAQAWSWRGSPQQFDKEFEPAALPQP